MKVDITVPDWATYIVSDLTDMERDPHPVDASKVSRFSLKLPDDVYFEYAFLDAAGEMRADPLNEVAATNPWYKNASAILGPDYAPGPYATPNLVAAGRVIRHRLKSELLGQTRRLTLYTPLGYEDAELPTVYVQDGTAYYRLARLADVLETLLHENKLRPAHLVFIEPIDRTLEYRYDPHYRAFIVDELIPYTEKTLNPTGERIAMGASLGGLVSSTLALHYPDLFAAVASQSGAFVGSPEAPDFYRGKTSWLLAQLEQLDPLPLRWYLDTGTIEWLTDINRDIGSVLEKKGYSYKFVERNAGHNWTNWRNGLAAALEFVLSPS